VHLIWYHHSLLLGHFLRDLRLTIRRSCYLYTGYCAQLYVGKSAVSRIRNQNINIFGAGCMSPLELFDCIVKEHDLLVIWNDETRKLLEQEIVEETQIVTY
jgi:hypothetical protein